MVKGIINAFDHMKLCLVIHLTKGSNWIIPRPPIFATGYFSFATTFYTRYMYKGANRKSLKLFFLTLLHSVRPKLYTILAFLSAIGLNTQLNDLRKIICLRKSEVTVERISVCNVTEKK